TAGRLRGGPLAAFWGGLGRAPGFGGNRRKDPTRKPPSCSRRGFLEINLRWRWGVKGGSAPLKWGGTGRAKHPHCARGRATCFVPMEGTLFGCCCVYARPSNPAASSRLMLINGLSCSRFGLVMIDTVWFITNRPRLAMFWRIAAGRACSELVADTMKIDQS